MQRIDSSEQAGPHGIDQAQPERRRYDIGNEEITAMKTKRTANLIASVFLVIVALSSAFYGRRLLAAPAAKGEQAQGVPAYRVDPFWPKRLPNRWSMQQVTGLYVEQK